MLEVVHITSDIDNRTNSGSARVARELITSLASTGEVRQTFVHFEESSDPIYELPNTSSILIPVGRNRFTRSRSFSFFWFWVKYRIQNSQYRFDIVHWHSSRVFLLFFLIPSKGTVITLHDAGNQILPSARTFHNFIYYWNVRLFIFKVSKIIAVSESAKSDLIEISRFPREKVVSIHNGTSFHTITSEPIAGFKHKRFLLCVSRWQPHKNVEMIIQAVDEIRDFISSSEFSLILVGKPVGNYDLPRRLIGQLSLENIVFCLEDLTDRELSFLYERSYLNLCPSLHEGFGLSSLEGMTKSCPPLIHDSPVAREIVGDAGFYADMHNKYAVASTISYLLTNRDLVNNMRDLCYQRALKFTWDNAAREILKEYRRVVN